MAVPVRLFPGLPTPLKDIELTDEEAGAMIIGRWRPALEKLSDGAAGVEEMRKAVKSRPQAARLLEPWALDLRPAEDLARGLLAVVEEHDPLKKILAVKQDILGVYRFPSSLKKDRPDLDLTGLVSIELYWAVIGLVAQHLGTPVEALAVVVLAHELAHAYTHLGRDIDGHRWNTHSFAGSGPGLVEGLAQYYTERVCRRLREQYSDAWDAYEALLKRQPGDYQSHRVHGWTDCYRPEEVRLALIGIRRQAGGSLPAFNQSLNDARDRLREPGS